MDCSPPGSSVHEIFPGKDTAVCCHFLLQGIFPTQGSNPGFLHCRQILYQLSYKANPIERLYSKSFKLGFSNMWTENFQMYKLSLEKAKEPEIKLLTFTGSQRKQGDSRKTSCNSLTYTKAYDFVTQLVDHNKLWKILKAMGILGHLTFLLWNLYLGQEETVRTLYGTTDWFKIGKGVQQGCILSPCLFNLYTEYVMRNAGLDE